MRVSDGFGNAQAKATALNHRSVRGITTKETLKDTRPQFWGQRHSRITDLKNSLLILSTQAECDAAVLLIVLHGIIGEIEQKLAKAHPVAADEDKLASRHYHRDIGTCSQHLRVFFKLTHQHIQGYRLMRKGELISIGFSEKGELTDNRIKTLNLLQH